MKDKLIALLKTIISIIKVGLFYCALTSGFWFIYGLIWITSKLPLADWSMWLIFFIAFASALGFTEWCDLDPK